MLNSKSCQKSKTTKIKQKSKNHGHKIYLILIRTVHNLSNKYNTVHAHCVLQMYKSNKNVTKRKFKPGLVTPRLIIKFKVSKKDDKTGKGNEFIV